MYNIYIEIQSIFSPNGQTWIGFRKPKNMCTYNGFTGLRLQQTQAGTWMLILMVVVMMRGKWMIQIAN